LRENGGKRFLEFGEEGFEDTRILGWLVMGEGVEIMVSMSLFSIDLMGEGAIGEASNKHINEWEGFFGFYLHSK